MVLVFIHNCALEASFAIGWWVMKKSAEATYVSKNTAIAIYDVYQDHLNG